MIRGSNFLGFAGVEAPRLRVYPVETHIAEKLHAYTMPRPRPNSRVKDLPDLALLASAGPLHAARIVTALEQTFAFRNTHALPPSLPSPHRAWRTPYAAMAKADELPWPTLDEMFAAASTFLSPVLAGRRTGIWEATSWSWSSAEEPHD